MLVLTASSLGGTCSVDSAPGEGTRVEVSLPGGRGALHVLTS
jgi:chemotaxis protein histidine kinase CheA